MGGEIIAERFSLLKTRGSNGVAFTHIVEDVLDGRRLVVKVSDRLGILGLEYLKAANLLSERGVRGVLLPLEGGLLDGEEGYYLAFPELGEPSLENYLRMRPSLACEEVVHILEGVLSALQGLHRAGFLHLFLEPRNVFYLPRGSVTLKDPALRAEFFPPFLELVSAPDFSYLQPGLMDGGLPGPEADLYALGKLAAALYARARDRDSSPLGRVILRMVETCEKFKGQVPGTSEGDTVEVMASLREELERALLQARSRKVNTGSYLKFAWRGRRRGSPARDGEGSSMWPEAERETAGNKVFSRHGRSRKTSRFPRRGLMTRSLRAVVLVACMGLLLSLPLYLVVAREGREMEPALGWGASEAGGGKVVSGLREVQKGPGPEETGSVSPAGGAGNGAVKAETGPSPAPGGATGVVAEPSPPGEEDTAPGPVSPQRPVARFTLTPAEGQSPLRVYLDASGSYDTDGHVVSYQWSCGGGAKAFYHVFESNLIPARIAVTLTVTDDGGNTDSVTHYVTLY